MADIDRLIGFMAIMQVPFMNDPDALAYIEEVKTVLKQVKAQEPVKPLVAGRGKSFETAETWWYECGNCGAVLTLGDKYCRKCGREVKWE